MSNGMLKCAKLNMEERSINDEVSVSAACPNNDVLRGVTNYQSADQCFLFEASLLNVKSIDLVKDVDEIKPNRWGTVDGRNLHQLIW